jgi:acyl-CoA thioester hydrolase
MTMIMVVMSSQPKPADPPEVTERIELSPADIDGLGHLNQARYHGLLGEARFRLLTRSFPEANRVDGTFVLARVELDYHHEVRLVDGYVDVHARIVRVGTKSITIENELVRPEGVVAATGVVVMVAWNKDQRRSRPVSDAERSVYDGAAAPGV